jgi:hypothetical protein
MAQITEKIKYIVQATTGSARMSFASGVTGSLEQLESEVLPAEERV